MTEDRLNGLLMYINKGIKPSYDKLIDIFSESNRFLKLLQLLMQLLMDRLDRVSHKYSLPINVD